ncbi:hypothetical protein I4F81_003811 [Pyropia yezoensis]|uniref:Uncharacterized protein n=1 Tax=Pyropia yezoensis TaxID=2788 RepID=A0ACC3BTK3_PYRYE|nr:hypothetical protein I4F81_003811 [Neopyropia yezoensis]
MACRRPSRYVAATAVAAAAAAAVVAAHPLTSTGTPPGAAAALAVSARAFAPTQLVGTFGRFIAQGDCPATVAHTSMFNPTAGVYNLPFAGIAADGAACTSPGSVLVLRHSDARLTGQLAALLGTKATLRAVYERLVASGAGFLVGFESIDRVCGGTTFEAPTVTFFIGEDVGIEVPGVAYLRPNSRPYMVIFPGGDPDPIPCTYSSAVRVRGQSSSVVVVPLGNVDFIGDDTDSDEEEVGPSVGVPPGADAASAEDTDEEEMGPSMGVPPGADAASDEDTDEDTDEEEVGPSMGVPPGADAASDEDTDEEPEPSDEELVVVPVPVDDEELVVVPVPVDDEEPVVVPVPVDDEEVVPVPVDDGDSSETADADSVEDDSDGILIAPSDADDELEEEGAPIVPARGGTDTDSTGDDSDGPADPTAAEELADPTDAADGNDGLADPADAAGDNDGLADPTDADDGQEDDEADANEEPAASDEEDGVVVGVDDEDFAGEFESSPSTDQPSDDSVCFPASAKVELESGATVTMDKLAVGDSVRVSADAFSRVFMFTHKVATGSFNFVKLSTASAASLTVTRSHYVYANGKMTAAGAVRVGDQLELAADRTCDVVTAIAPVTGTGLYNPQTLHGDIVVNGLRASTYTTAVEPAVASALLAPLRALFRATGVSTSALYAGASRLATLLPTGSPVVG